MVNDPNGEKNHNEYDGNGGNKNSQVPECFLFLPHINEEDKLNEGLQDSENKYREDGSPVGKIKKIRIQDDKIS